MLMRLLGVCGIVLGLQLGPAAADPPEQGGQSADQPAAAPISPAAKKGAKLAATPAVVKVVIQRGKGRIDVIPPYVQICRNAASCRENEIEWEVLGGLEANETLKIRGARTDCFSWSTLEISSPEDGAASGAPIASCTAADKYGFFWPYIIELFVSGNSTPIAATDPGGIFH
jgi:hypothetical protein